MKLPLEITVESVEEYLQLLNALDRAEENGESGSEWSAGPASSSHAAIAMHALVWTDSE